MDIGERVPSACNYQLKSAPLIEEIAKVVIFGGPHEIIVRPKGDKNFVSEWGERRHKSPNDASVILCDLVAERENSSQQENMQKRADLKGRLSFVHTGYPILKVHSTDFFSNIFFLSKAAYAWGRNSSVRSLRSRD